jgi:hypothetical protein
VLNGPITGGWLDAYARHVPLPMPRSRDAVITYDLRPVSHPGQGRAI